MRLLVITQKVDINDDVLGFFHVWLEKLAEKVEFIDVICLWQGRYKLLDNVKVFSLGKEEGFSKLRQAINFYRLIWALRKDYDAVFVHMNPIWVILGAPIFKVFHKKIGLWYVHRSITLKQKLATVLADYVFTASEESFRLKTRKKRIIGHGIDTEFFKPGGYKKRRKKVFRIITIGRITRIKNLETLILADDLLKEEVENLEVLIMGKPQLEKDFFYKKELENLIKSRNLGRIVRFKEPVIFNKTREAYHKADLVINLAPTGGLDKVVLEAMAMEKMVLVANESFGHFFGKYSRHLIFEFNNPQDLAKKIKGIRELPSKKITQYLRSQVVKNHNLDRLLDKILKILGENE